MTITLTLPMVVFSVSLLIGWTGLLLGAIKWLLNRQLTSFDEKIKGATEKASTTADDLSKHKERAAQELASLRLEFSQKLTCGNHDRMEKNDEKLFSRLDKLHGDIRELCGEVKAAVNSINLLNEHHLNKGD